MPPTMTAVRVKLNLAAGASAQDAGTLARWIADHAELVTGSVWIAGLTPPRALSVRALVFADSCASVDDALRVTLLGCPVRVESIETREEVR